MKRIATLFIASTFAITLVAACGEDPVGAPRNNDDDCSADEVCKDDVCQQEECATNRDCDLSVRGDAISKDDLDDGNTTCESQNLATVVDYNGTEVCMVGADAAVGCDDGLVRIDAPAPGGGTVEVCVSGDGVCSLGTCE